MELFSLLIFHVIYFKIIIIIVKIKKIVHLDLKQVYSSRIKIWPLPKNGLLKKKYLIKLMNLYSINVFQRKSFVFY